MKPEGRRFVAGLARAAGLLVLLTATGACATVASGNRQQVHFETYPPEATATVDGLGFTTPADVNLKRKNTYEVVFEKPGYIPAHRRISHSTNPAFYGNIILGGLIGMIIDMSTGAYYNLDPDVLSVTLIEDPAYTGAAEAHGTPEGQAPAGAPKGAGVTTPETPGHPEPDDSGTEASH